LTSPLARRRLSAEDTHRVAAVIAVARSSPELGRPPRWPPSLRADLEALSLQLEAHSARMLAASPGVLADLEAMLLPRFPSARLGLYGSVPEGTAGLHGDYDATLELGPGDLERWRQAGSSTAQDGTAGDPVPRAVQSAALRDLSGLAQASSTWALRRLALDARVPSATLAHRSAGLRVDLTIGRAACVQQSRDLGRRMPPRARRLVQVVKYWARRRRLYGRAHGRLSGFAFTLLAVFFCQVSDAFQELSGGLAGFFAFYASDFDWAHECVSVAAGRRTAKSTPWLRRVPHLSIEDPFDRWTDICVPHLTEAECSRLQEEFRRAHRMMHQTSGVSLADILSEAMEESLLVLV
ncbi:unnamed protein product, partial [Prorocentrum cordatum]